MYIYSMYLEINDDVNQESVGTLLKGLVVPSAGNYHFISGNPEQQAQT